MPLLFYSRLSSACRSVLLCSRYINVPLDLEEMDVHEAHEHKDWSYRMMNPQQVVPTIVDGDYVLWESRAINKYLVSKFPNDYAHTLWPKNIKHRSIIERMLYFDIGMMYPRAKGYFRGLRSHDDDRIEEATGRVEEVLTLFNHLIRDTGYAAGPHITLADLSLISTIGHLESLDYSYAHFRNVRMWTDRMKGDLPFYDEICQEGIKLYRAYAINRLNEVD